MTEQAGQTPGPTRQEVIDWLNASRMNALRLASMRSGTSREGWLEDASYYAAAIAFLRATGDQP